MTSKMLKRTKDGKRDGAPRIAHIRDWEVYEATGQIKGLCGTKLKGLPAVGYQDCCVVCLGLDGNRGLRAP